MATPPNALTYNLYVQQVGVMAVTNTTTTNGIVVGTDDAFNSIIPQMLNYAELRIQRDMELLPFQTTNNTYSLGMASNILSVAVGDMLIIQDVTWLDSSNNVTPILPTSKEFIQNVYGSKTVTGPPQYFAMYGGDSATAGQTSNNILFGPWADQVYTIGLVGQIRMPSLYQSATQALAATGTTWISTWLPDLLIQASMVYITEFQRGFSAVSNDPQMGQTYETQYLTLLAGAKGENYRQKFEADAWSAQATSPVATPSR